MQIQTRNTRHTRGEVIGWGSRGYKEAGYIAVEAPGFDARSVARRSLQQPGFLRNCERVLFESNDQDASFGINSLLTARER